MQVLSLQSAFISIHETASEGGLILCKVPSSARGRNLKSSQYLRVEFSLELLLV